MKNHHSLSWKLQHLLRPQDSEMKKLRDEASSNLSSIASSLRLLSVSLRFCQIIGSSKKSFKSYHDIDKQIIKLSKS